MSGFLWASIWRFTQFKNISGKVEYEKEKLSFSIIMVLLHLTVSTLEDL